MSDINKKYRLLLLLSITIIFVLGLSNSIKANSTNLIKNSLCDIRILYLFDNEKLIDWPTVYYLNDNFGCQIDLVSLKERSR
ncbi:hypothetical protein ACFLQG_00840, partial [Candidatus Zixiibacteriota bacterium]